MHCEFVQTPPKMYVDKLNIEFLRIVLGGREDFAKVINVNHSQFSFIFISIIFFTFYLSLYFEIPFLSFLICNRIYLPFAHVSSK